MKQKKTAIWGTDKTAARRRKEKAGRRTEKKARRGTKRDRKVKKRKRIGLFHNHYTSHNF